MKTIYFRHFKSYIALKLWYELESIRLKKDFEIINIQSNETGYNKGYLVFYFRTT